MKRKTYNNVLKAGKLIQKKGYEEKEALELAVQKFDELAKQLVDLKIMTNLDCDVLARYIKSESEYIKVTKQLQKIKFVPDKKSMVPADAQLAEQYAQYNYLSKIQNRLMKACNENAKELGLTISSRCKLVIPKEKEEKPQNKFMKHAQ